MIGTISGSITHRKFSAVLVWNKSEFAPQLSKPKNKSRVWLHFCVSAAAGYLNGQNLNKKSTFPAAAAPWIYCIAARHQIFNESTSVTFAENYVWVCAQNMCVRFVYMLNLFIAMRPREIINGGSFINSQAAAAPLTREMLYVCGYLYF